MDGAINSLNAGVVLVDGGGVVRAWSRGLERQLGVARERSLGEPWARVLETALAPLLDLDSAAVASLAGPPPERDEPVAARLLDDTASTISFSRTALTEGGFLVEVTVDAANHQHEQLLQAVYDAMPDMILVHDTSGELIEVNASTCRGVGANKEEIAARGLWNVMGAMVDIDEAYERMARAVEGEEQDFEWTGRRLDGREFPAEVRLRRVPAFDRPGEYNVLALVRDITERKRAEEALRASEERYRAMFERNTAMKWIIDPADGRILDVNAAAASFYGYSRDELLQMRVTDLNIAPPDEVAAQMGRASTEERVHFYFQHRKKSGEVADVEVHSGPLRLDGRVVLLSIINDVSERRRLEEQLRVAHKMEALGRLAGGVAHDFNNLMTVVIGASAHVAAQLPEGSPLRQQVSDIEESGRRAARLTQQLLAVGSRQVLSLRTLDLNAALLHSSSMLRHVLPPQIEVVRELAAQRPFVRADPDQLDQVLLNLVVNARDAMPSGGRLTLQTANVELAQPARDTGELPPGAYVLFVVQDTGVGIPPARLSQVFEPFYTTKGGDKGTGLGLATVYGIVKQSGGHISVESTPGVGSRFRILLPAAKAPATAEELARLEPAATPRPRGSETVLLVDDDDLVRKVAGMMLSSQGYNVLAASDGEGALHLSASHPGPIDVLLTDVLMPQMGGDALALELRAQRPDLRVLFMSGSTNNTVLPRQALGARVGFLQKPLTPDALAAAVRELLGAG